MRVCAMCEGFVCGHSETVEYVRLGGSGSGGVGIGMRNFRGVVSIWTQTCIGIFKSALVYL